MLEEKGKHKDSVNTGEKAHTNMFGGYHTLSAVDREFKPLSGQTKDYKMCICCFLS